AGPRSRALLCDSSDGDGLRLLAPASRFGNSRSDRGRAAEKCRKRLQRSARSRGCNAKRAVVQVWVGAGARDSDRSRQDSAGPERETEADFGEVSGVALVELRIIL